MNKATKAKLGRKPDEAETRSERFELRLTVGEKMRLLANGGADWVRRKLFGGKS